MISSFPSLSVSDLRMGKRLGGLKTELITEVLGRRGHKTEVLGVGLGDRLALISGSATCQLCRLGKIT